jgi:DNA-binding transcriptional ArsR family regulator/uncharacterized protein YndB with AHSA1/START domain
MDDVFKALADPTRRLLLDSLNKRNGQSLQELCAGLEAMTRQSVTKHLAVLEAAGLVVARKDGRRRLHYLNAAPINEISERWIGRYDRDRARALADLKHALEDSPMERSEFVYVTYIQTTPEKLWQALTDTAFTDRYFGRTGPKSDWALGSSVTWQLEAAGEYLDLGQVVLEAEPCRRLSYSWHNYQWAHAGLFGWTEEQFAELQKERISKVTFEIEPFGRGCRLTVLHDGFEGETEMLKGISQGWPMILSGLKTLLETGQDLVSAEPAEAAETAV